MRRLLGVALLCASGLTQAAEFSARVIAVIDGDTILVKRAHDVVKIRLADIDAPEKAQPYGDAASQSLTEMVMGKEVIVTSRAVDDYGRIVAVIHSNHHSVNSAQVQRGMAWAQSFVRSQTHPQRNGDLVALQREAQLAKRGLWAEPDAIEPSLWRKQHPIVLRTQPNEVSSNSAFRCGNKKYCSQMSSCAEALHYLNRCGIRTLDGNDDGIPCEALCLQAAN